MDHTRNKTPSSQKVESEVGTTKPRNNPPLETCEIPSTPDYHVHNLLRSWSRFHSDTCFPFFHSRLIFQTLIFSICINLPFTLTQARIWTVIEGFSLGVKNLKVPDSVGTGPAPSTELVFQHYNNEVKQHIRANYTVTGSQ